MAGLVRWLRPARPPGAAGPGAQASPDRRSRASPRAPGWKARPSWPATAATRPARGVATRGLATAREWKKRGAHQVGGGVRVELEPFLRDTAPQRREGQPAGLDGDEHRALRSRVHSERAADDGASCSSPCHGEELQGEEHRQRGGRAHPARRERYSPPVARLGMCCTPIQLRFSPRNASTYICITPRVRSQGAGMSMAAAVLLCCCAACSIASIDRQRRCCAARFGERSLHPAAACR